ICNHCLSAAASDRFATGLELQAAFEEYADSSGGVFSRRELGAFLSRSFESQRARRRAVIEEKVKALSDGATISDSVKRARAVLPEEQRRTSRPVAASSNADAGSSSGERAAMSPASSEAPV